MRHYTRLSNNLANAVRQLGRVRQVVAHLFEEVFSNLTPLEFQLDCADLFLDNGIFFHDVVKTRM